MLYRTIAAIATPLGESSIGVIRISGENAVSIADKVFFPFSGKPLSSLAGYRAERLDVRHVTRDATVPSGVALICVDGAAENSIVVAPGANER